jgi:hypothetical protein
LGWNFGYLGHLFDDPAMERVFKTYKILAVQLIDPAAKATDSE